MTFGELIVLTLKICLPFTSHTEIYNIPKLLLGENGALSFTKASLAVSTRVFCVELTNFISDNARCAYQTKHSERIFL